ncbi:MAG: phage head completion protein [Pirellulales bacterium]
MTSLELNDDLACCDRLEAVTVVEPGGASARVAGALRRAATAREAAPGNGCYVQSDLVWHLPAEELAAPPSPGARIIDAAGDAWTVLSVQRQALGSRWRCHARNLVIAGGLDRFVTLQKATWNPGPSGALVATWRDERTGLAARIQPQESSVQTRQGCLAAPARCKVYLAEQVPVDESWRIVHGKEIYDVVGYEIPERIDGLFVIQVEAALG